MKFVLYDEDCPYCTGTVKIADELSESNINVLSWQSHKAQDFLEIQFNDVPFTLLFIDTENDTVLAGSDAAEEINSESVGSDVVGSIVSEGYKEISELVGLLSGRTREVDLENGRFDLDPDAKSVLV